MTRLNNSLTPKEIVRHLDRFIVGQQDAKRAIAVSLRNRMRRQAVDSEMAKEISPKNIMMIGPTGVGKTEIARRLAALAQAPFIKVEATKFTEVGYVGRDVESIIRDLMDLAVQMARASLRTIHAEEAAVAAKQRVLNALVGQDSSPATREKFSTMLSSGALDAQEVEMQFKEVKQSGFSSVDLSGYGAQQSILTLIEKLSGPETRLVFKRMSVKEALSTATEEEMDANVSEEEVVKCATRAVEETGIVFLDEMDKLVSHSEMRASGKGDVSREGVQRDLLPLIEGTSVNTKYGPIRTDHVLFITSGAFYSARPSDLLPELQGRIPIRVELQGLSEGDLVRILTEPEFNLLKQYQAMLKTEGLSLSFTDEAVSRIAEVAFLINRDVENIGARRLHTVLEKLLEEVSFDASSAEDREFAIDVQYVDSKLSTLVKTLDLGKFIL